MKNCCDAREPPFSPTLSTLNYFINLNICVDKWTEADKTRFIDAAQEKSCRASYIRQDPTNGKYDVRIWYEGVNGVRTVINELFGYPQSTGISVPTAEYSSMSIPMQDSQVFTAYFVDLDKFFLSPDDLTAHEVFILISFTGIGELFWLLLVFR